MRVSLGYGVLRDYSGMDVRGKTFFKYFHLLYPDESNAIAAATQWAGRTRVVEVFCEVPDGDE